MKLIRIVKGEASEVDYDEATALKMLALNPDRYKRVEDYEMPKLQFEKIDEPEIIDSEE